MSLIGFSLAKRLGNDGISAIFSNETAKGIFENILIDGSDKLVEPIAKILDNLKISRVARQTIERNPTLFDLAGIAWSQALNERPDADFAAFARDASSIRRTLSPRWFVDVLLGIPASEVGFDFGRWDPRKQFSTELTMRLIVRLGTEAIDELEISADGPDELIVLFIQGVIAELPSRIEVLFLAIPGVNDVITRIAAEAARDAALRAKITAEATHTAIGHIASLLDGSETSRLGLEALNRVAIDNIKQLERDVFGRESAASDEFALLPLESTYVEPGSLRGRHDDDVPVLTNISTAISRTTGGITALLAPFGFGKSLTVRFLAAKASRGWQTNPSERFPLLIHAPDVLSSQARTLEEAVRIHLERAFQMDLNTAQWIWQNIDLLLILDSFDEVIFQPSEAKGWIKTLHDVAKHGRHRILVASREYAIELRWLKPEDEQISILPFDADRIKSWLERTSGRVHDGSLSQEQIITWLGADLAGTPILLLMAAWDWKSSEETRLFSKGDLYSRFFSRISRGKWHEIQEAHPVVDEGAHVLESLRGEGSFQRALARIAWAHYITDSDRNDSAHVLPVRDVEGILRSEFCTTEGLPLNESHLAAVQKGIILSVFVRRAQGDDGIRFAHKSFREFLCAKYLAICLQEKQSDGYVHPGKIALAQVHLGLEEIGFAADLIHTFSEAEQERILSLLDKMFRDRKSVHLKSFGVEILAGRSLDAVVLLDPDRITWGNRVSTNAEMLALSIRRRNLILHTTRYRTEHAPRIVGEYRILELAHQLRMGVSTAYKIDSTNDEIVAFFQDLHIPSQAELSVSLQTVNNGKNAILPLPSEHITLGERIFIHSIEMLEEKDLSFDNLCSLGRELNSLTCNGWRPLVRGALFAWLHDGRWVIGPLIRGASVKSSGESNDGRSGPNNEFESFATSMWLDFALLWIRINRSRSSAASYELDPAAYADLDVSRILSSSWSSYGPKRDFVQIYDAFVRLVTRYLVTVPSPSG